MARQGRFRYYLSLPRRGSDEIFSREDRPACRKEPLYEAIMELGDEISATSLMIARR